MRTPVCLAIARIASGRVVFRSRLTGLSSCSLMSAEVCEFCASAGDGAIVRQQQITRTKVAGRKHRMADPENGAPAAAARSWTRGALVGNRASAILRGGGVARNDDARGALEDAVVVAPAHAGPLLGGADADRRVEVRRADRDRGRAAGAVAVVADDRGQAAGGGRGDAHVDRALRDRARRWLLLIAEDH